jgi:hypothetical protein
METLANLIDVSMIPNYYVPTSQFYLTDFGVIGQQTAFMGYRAIESLVGVQQGNNYSLSGNYVHDLFSAQAQLLAARKKTVELLRQFVAHLHSGDEFRPIDLVEVIPFEQLLEFFDRQAKYTFTPPIGILNLLLDDERARNLLRQIFARITFVWKAVTLGVPRFCAVNWARRQWFLMHGIRPPRTGAPNCSVFECAPL